MKTISKHKIQIALKKGRAWNLGNKVLYKLCSSNPGHKTDQEIIAKVWLIGRSYSAAIERRKNKLQNSNGGKFYVKKVVPKIRKSEIDQWFSELKVDHTPSKIVEVHKKLTKLFSKISGQKKRSLASKYLHFHFQRFVFIYDSRAMSAIRVLTPKKGLKIQVSHKKSDKEYKHFFERCLWLKKDLELRLKRKLLPREIDNILLHI